ncbi:MAG: hypothetical protein ACR2NO_03480 [Chloroflexota bacterium]
MENRLRARRLRAGLSQGDLAEHQAVALLEALQTRALRDELRTLPGYDVHEIGSVREEIAA